MAGYSRGDTREYEKSPLEFAWMWIISQIERFLRIFVEIYGKYRWKYPSMILELEWGKDNYLDMTARTLHSGIFNETDTIQYIECLQRWIVLL